MSADELLFYHSPYSTSCATEAVIAELALPHKRIDVSLRDGQTRTPEFLRLNPNGHVPTIVHRGTPIFESAAIAIYLADEFGVKKGLFPASGPKRGEALKWIVWANVKLAESVHRASLAKVDSPSSKDPSSHDFVPEELKRPVVIEKARKDVFNNYKIFDDAVAGKQFLLGDDYTLADTHLYTFFLWAKMCELDLKPYANLSAWFTRVGERPAFASSQ